MQYPVVSLPGVEHVFPIDRVALDRAKRDTLIILFIAIDELAPFLVLRCLEDGEVRATASDIVGFDVCEDGGDAVPAK